MKSLFKHKHKIIVCIFIVAFLSFVYWWGGDAPSLKGQSIKEPETAAQTKAFSNASVNPYEAASDKAYSETNEKDEFQASAPSADTTEINSDNNENQKEENTGSSTSKKDNEFISENIQSSNDALSPLTCTLSVRCDTILDNISWLEEEKLSILPSDGVIFAEKEVVFYEGESVFDVLLREMKNNKIHLEYVNTPVYNSTYIEGIANLYEFDCGELSGWLYSVNNTFPSYGCSRYKLTQGDKVRWLYTCDLGNDVGKKGGA